MNVPGGPTPRLSFWFRLFHPIQSYWIMFLVREAYRFPPNEAADRHSATNAELVVANKAIEAGRKALRTAVAAAADLIDRQVSALREVAALRERLELERNRVTTPKIRVSQTVVLPPMTVTQAQEKIASCQATVDADTARGDTKHLDTPSPVRRGFAYVLLTVDVLAIFSIFATLFNVDLQRIKFEEVVPAIGFSMIAAGVIAGLAHSAGHSVWKWRISIGNTPAEPEQQKGADPKPEKVEKSESPEFPPRRSTLMAKLLGLVVVSVLSGFSILVRVITEAKEIDMPVLGWVVGLLVGTAAVVAPWLVVIDEMRSGSLETKTIRALTKMVQKTEDDANNLLKQASAQETSATNLYNRAERLNKDAQDFYGGKRAEAEKIIYTARAMHTRTGRYAADRDDLSGPPESRDSLEPLFALDTSALEKLLGRMRPPGGATS